MSSHPLTITITAPPAGSAEENYWIRLAQTNADGDFATVADAAQVIDAVFELDPCEDAGTGGEAATLNPDGTYAAAVAEADFANVVKGVIDFDACLAAGRYDWTATLAIIRSHNAIPYNLVTEGGQLVQTVVVTEQITTNLVFAGETSLDLEFPVVAGLALGWSGRVVTKSGNPPQVTLLGSTINLSEAATGNLGLRYLTEYDRSTITIPGNGETSLQSAEVLAFWHYLVEPLALSPPEIDATSAGDRLLCEQQVSSDIPEETRCWETVRRLTLCSCGDGEYDSDEVEQSVSCPEGASPGDHYMGSRTVLVGYADCGKPAFDDISDPEFYKKTCCHPPGFPLPRCVIRKAVMSGGMGIVNGPQYYLDTYGPGTKIVGVSPRNGICGTIEWRQNISPKDCCAGAVPIEPIPALSASTINLNDSALVRVTDGVAPYHWSVNAPYFLSVEETDVPWNTVYSPKEVCGNATVQIEDQCSQTTWVIYQTAGHADPVSLPYDLIVAPDTDFHLSAAYGIGPFLWTVGGSVTMTGQSSDGRTAFFRTPPDFCGTGTMTDQGASDITVTDMCNTSATTTVRSTDGRWIMIGNDWCQPPGAPFPQGSAPGVSAVRGGYYAITSLSLHGSTGSCSGDEHLQCPMGNIITQDASLEAYCQGIGGIYAGGCCVKDSGLGYIEFFATTQLLTALYKWSC